VVGVRTALVTLAGALTSAGTVVKQVGKPVAVELTTAGVEVKATARTVAGTLTSAGTAAKATARALAGALTSAGTISRVTGKPLAGTLTSAGTAVKATARTVAGTLTTAGAAVKATARSLAGALTSAGTVVGEVQGALEKVLAGALGLAGALSKQTNKPLAGALTTAGTAAKATARALAGALTSAGALFRPLYDSFDRSNSSNLGANWTEDSGDWQINSNAANNNTATGAYRKLRWTGDALKGADNYAQVSARSESAGDGIGPAVRMAASSAVTYYTYMIFGSDRTYLIYIAAGTENILDTGAAITANTDYTLRLEVEGTTLRGYLNGTLDVEATHSTLSSGSVGLAAYDGSSSTNASYWTAGDLIVGLDYERTVAGVLALAGAVSKRTSRGLAGALTTAGVLAAVLIAIGETYYQAVSGALAPTGEIVRRTARTLAGVLGLAGSFLDRLIGPSAPKLDATLTDSALTTLVIGDSAQTVLTVGDSALTALVIGDAAV
jgi:hypothetical protein